MSDCPGVRCDSCGARALLELDDGTKRDRAPEGWGGVQIHRTRPFFNTGHLDLCPNCVVECYTIVRGKGPPA